MIRPPTQALTLAMQEAEAEAVRAEAEATAARANAEAAKAAAEAAKADAEAAKAALEAVEAEAEAVRVEAAATSRSVGHSIPGLVEAGTHLPGTQKPSMPHAPDPPRVELTPVLKDFEWHDDGMLTGTLAGEDDRRITIRPRERGDGSVLNAQRSVVDPKTNIEYHLMGRQRRSRSKQAHSTLDQFSAETTIRGPLGAELSCTLGGDTLGGPEFMRVLKSAFESPDASAATLKHDYKCARRAVLHSCDGRVVAVAVVEANEKMGCLQVHAHKHVHMHAHAHAYHAHTTSP